jgi:hypothetical protein
VSTDGAGNIGVPGPPPRDQQRGDENLWQETVHWFRADSTLVDTTLVPAGPTQRSWEAGAANGKRIRIAIPFTPALVYGFLPDRRLVLGVSDRYEFAITRRNGSDTVALFGRRWRAAEVPAAMRRARLAQFVADNKDFVDEALLRNAFVYSDVPATAPAFDWLGTDGAGDLWVRDPAAADTTSTRFDVFDPRFRWLGQVAGAPLLRERMLRNWGMGIAGDRMYGFGEDDRGEPVVVVYRIDRR